MPGQLRGITTDSASDVLQATRYAYDPNGNLNHFVPDLLSSGGESILYEYDGFDRLKKSTAFSGSGPAVADYVYNDAGDITSQTGVGSYTYGNHQLTIFSAGNVQGNYLLDANGNQWERSGPLVK